MKLLMTKIKVDVPKENCIFCKFFEHNSGSCSAFNCYIHYNRDKRRLERCDKCKQAEVENDETIC